MSNPTPNLFQRICRAAGVEVLLVVAALVHGAALFQGMDRWGRGDWDQFTFRYETPRTAMLRDGQWPLWNPYPGGGNVLLAHPHCPAFSPWYPPAMALGAPMGLRVRAVLFAAVGAVGMSVLLRRFGVSAAGRFAGGVLLMLSAHFTLHVTEGHLEWAALGLAPWIVLCLVEAAGRPRLVAVAGLLLGSAVLDGSIYVVAVFAPVLTLWAALESARGRSWNPLVRWLGAAVLGGLVSAVALLPRIEFVRANPRPTELYERVSPAALPRMLLDPRQAGLFRATRDLRNPPHEELGRILPAELPLYRAQYEMRPWHRLEVTLATTSDWTDLRFEGFPYVLRTGDEAAETIPAWRLDAMPPGREGLALQNPDRQADRLELRATLYVRLPKKGPLRLVVTRGDYGVTWVKVVRDGEALLDEAHNRRVGEDGSNRLEYTISRETILGRLAPRAFPPGGTWHRVEATLESTADWCDARVSNCPYLFVVEPPEVEAAAELPPSTQPLSLPPAGELPSHRGVALIAPLSGRRSRKMPSEDATSAAVATVSPMPLVPAAPRLRAIGATLATRRLRAVWLVCLPDDGSSDDEGLRVTITQGRLGASSVALRAADGRPLEASVVEFIEPNGEKRYEYHVAGAELRRRSPGQATPLRWRLNRLGMTYDWHEYACYLTWAGLACALLGVVAAWRRHWPLLVAGATAGVVAMGSVLPVSLWGLMRLLPAYGSLQVPSRFLMAVVFVAAVAAGFGLDRLGQWAGRLAGRAAGAALAWALAAAIYAELAVLGWNAFSGIFDCPPRSVPAHEQFAMRYAEDEARYAAMYSAMTPCLEGNSGVLAEYENIALPRGDVRIAGDPDYRGEAYLDQGHGSARLAEWTMGRVGVALDVAAADRAVVNQNHFVGWKARVRRSEGWGEWHPAERSPGGLVSRSVQPGDLEIEFRYVPDTFVWGAVVSVLTLVGCVGYLLAAVPRAPGQHAGPKAPGLRSRGLAQGKPRHRSGGAFDESEAQNGGGAFDENEAQNGGGAFDESDSQTSGALRLLAAAAALSAPFALCHPAYVLVDCPLLRSMAVGAVLLVVPGWPLVGVLVGRRWVARPGPAWVVLASLGVLLAVLGVFRLLGWHPTAAAAWNAAWLATLAGLAVCALVGGKLRWAGGRENRDSPREAWADRLVAAAVFLGAYVVFYWAATRMVPPQEDHDLDVSASGHALATRFEPLLAGDYQTVYQLAHPPALHYFVAGSFLYFDRLDDLRYYDEASLRAKAAIRGEPVAPFAGTVRHLPGSAGEHLAVGVAGSDYLVEPPLADGSTRLPAVDFEHAVIAERYRERPHRLEARTPSIFLAAAVAAMLGVWVRRTTGSWPAALLVAAAYATSPEVFVRSSYGGYFAVSMFAAMTVLLAVERSARRPSRSAWLDCLAAGLLAALVNHKLALLPVAVVLWEMAQLGKVWTPRRAAAALGHPVVIGFALGTVIFWAYGAAFCPRALFVDHLRHHVVDRIVHHNPLGYVGYPSAVGLWVELSRNTGRLLLPLGLAALVALCTRREPPDDVQPSGYTVRGWRNTPGLWLVWTLLMAIAFSLIDWRQTKHLMPILLPLHMAPMRWAAGRAGAMVFVAALFTIILGVNFGTLLDLSADFASLVVTPAW